jgi:PAS domain S-box-containing protein
LKTRQQKESYPFLQGGGEMGRLIRNYDWSKTSIGNSDYWPQALRLSLTNVLNSGFPMFLFWGDDLTCFYNDAFRPSLGVGGKHPAIGKNGQEVWTEIWDFIGPLIEGVLTTGKPVWFENQLVPFYRNGQMEDIYWTFSYSLLIRDDGKPGGVLVTCMETTQTVLAQKKLDAAHNRFASLVSEAPIAINIQTGQDMIIELANDPSLEIWGKTGDDVLGKSLLDVLPELKVQGAQDIYRQVVETGQPFYAEEMPFKLIRESQEQLAWFNLMLQPYFDGDNTTAKGMVTFATEVTAQVKARQYLIESEGRFRNMIEQAPVAIALTRGEDFIFESVNPPMLRIIHKKHKDHVLGKSLREVLPELVSQPVFDILQDVLRTGVAFSGTEVETELANEGILQRRYFNISYSRIFDATGTPFVLHMSADITEQVLAKRKIEESEAKLRSILNSAPTAMGVFVGPDLIVENPNQLLIEVMAAGPDIEGKSFRQLLSGLVEEDQSFIGLIDTVRTTGQAFEAQEVEVFFKVEKKTRYFNISFIPLLDESGNVYAVLDVSVNVTEQVLARKKMEESEGRFRLLADASPILIWMLKSDGSYSYVNKTTLEFLDITQEQIAKVGWVHFLHPDDLEPATRAIAEAVQNQRPYEMEHRLRDKHGEYRWLLSQATPAYDANGDVFAYVGSSIDIHEAKKSRQALQTALEQVRLSKEAAELGTFDMDLEIGTMHWDDRCRILFGITHHRPVSFDDDFINRLHPDDQQRVAEVVRQSFDKSLTNGDYDVEYRTIGAEDGVERWVKAKGKVYFDEKATAVRFIGSVLDITAQMTARQKIEKTVEERTRELAKANESLQVINKELQRSNQNLEEFAYAASHDLKEPVRKIQVFTNQLKDLLSKHLNENEARSFSRIENATKRMGSLIDDLLLYSHVSQRPHETEAVDLNQKVQRVLEDLELDIEEKKAVIRVGKLPVVKGYRRQLQQLFQNLISNALKYSKVDELPVIKITASRVTEKQKLYNVISVEDNGIGFEPEYAVKIFQMFTRLHNKGEYSGTGVGLSIAKKVMENHNGFIRVESIPGKGSTFRAYLPAS